MNDYTNLVERLRRGWLRPEFTPLEFNEAADAIEFLVKELKIANETIEDLHEDLKCIGLGDDFYDCVELSKGR